MFSLTGNEPILIFKCIKDFMMSFTENQATSQK